MNPGKRSHAPTRPRSPMPAPAGAQAGAPQSTRAHVPDVPGVALWQQLGAVAAALQDIMAGRSGTAVLAAVAPEMRPGVQALLYQVLRALGRAQALRSQLAARRPPPPVRASNRPKSGLVMLRLSARSMRSSLNDLPIRATLETRPM